MIEMLGKHYADQDCATARTLEQVGERWTLLIIRDALFRGSTRFGEFQRALGIATNVLASRLDQLVAAGLLDVGEGDGRRYTPTQRAWDLVATLMATTAWGERHARPGPIDYVERATGAPVKLMIVRADTGEEVAPEAVGVRLRTRPAGGEVAG